MSSPRAGADRCPGLLRPFIAGDGALVRLRVPGGRVRVSALAELLELGTRFGAPVLGLTSRGNVQLRTLPDPLPDAFVAGVQATGLLPSATHELVRNILAAPLALDLQDLVAELDVALFAEPRLASLPGRFLFAIDDAEGSVLGEPWDLAYQALTAGEGVVLVAGRGMPVRRVDAVAALLERARTFLASRPSARVWNVRDLPEESPVFAGTSPALPTVAAPLLPGPVDGPLGQVLVVGVPLGMLRAAHVAALGEVAETVTITPWRSLVVPGGPSVAAVLGAAGLVTEASSPWARLSSCVGAPHCRQTRSRTMDHAAAAAERLGSAGPRVHVVGCDRRCGEPRSEHILVIDPSSAQDVLAATRATR